MWEMEWTSYVTLEDLRAFMYGIKVPVVIPFPSEGLTHPAYGESYGFRTVQYAPGSL